MWNFNSIEGQLLRLKLKAKRDIGYLFVRAKDISELDIEINLNPEDENNFHKEISTIFRHLKSSKQLRLSVYSMHEKNYKEFVRNLSSSFQFIRKLDFLSINFEPSVPEIVTFLAQIAKYTELTCFKFNLDEHESMPEIRKISQTPKVILRNQRQPTNSEDIAEYDKSLLN